MDFKGVAKKVMEKKYCVKVIDGIDSNESDLNLPEINMIIMTKQVVKIEITIGEV